MASIITDTLRTTVAGLLFNELTTNSSDKYFIGIGKSDQYDSADTVIAPIRSLREERLVRQNLQSVKLLASSNVSYTIPRYNWISGTIYTGYNDYISGLPTNSYYVMTEENEVYICLKQARNNLGIGTASIDQPRYTTYATGSNPTLAFQTPDGYWWKYLYTITTARANAFLSANYMPTQFLDDSSGAYTGLDRDQALVKEASISGQVLGVVLTSGGTGYSSAPTVTIHGNGTSATATATIAGGTVVKVEMDNESAGLGSGYDYASISFSGGSPTTSATARAIIGPKQGIGYDPRNDLKSNSILLTTKVDGDEGGEFIIGQDFRQISIFKNLEYKDSSGVYSLTRGRALRSIRVDDATGFVADLVMTGDNSGAQAYIDQVDLDSDRIFYHQNENTGYIPFEISELVTISGNDATIIDIVDSAGRGPVDQFSGEVLYIENRAAISRSSSQTEDIKIVLTF